MFSKTLALASLVASATAFAPAPAFKASTALFADYSIPDVDPNPAPTTNEEALEMGWSMGGKAHTKDPTPQENDDARLTIPEGESFEEYMKRRAGETAAPAPAPVAAAPEEPKTEYALPDVDPNPTPTTNEEALEMGWSMGGKAHTKDPTPQENEDARLTIPEGESFEEYMKRRG